MGFPERERIIMLVTIGGDGTQRGAIALAAESSGAAQDLYRGNP